MRPTTARLRRSLLDILAPRIPGSQWLDLFAGSGAVGIEALSRGADRVVFVDESTAAVRIIRENIQRANLPTERADVRRGSALRLMETLAAEGRRFDVVFADPPYGKGLVDAAVGAVARHGLIAPGGLLVVQHSSRERPHPPPGWAPARTVGHGETEVTFFAREAGGTS